jgi:hypothetical protein
MGAISLIFMIAFFVWISARTPQEFRDQPCSGLLFGEPGSFDAAAEIECGETVHWRGDVWVHKASGNRFLPPLPGDSLDNWHPTTNHEHLLFTPHAAHP